MSDIDLRKYKAGEYEKSLSIEITDFDNQYIGKMIAVGSWALSQKESIENICLWRQKFMKMFLSQFDSTYDKTVDYLKSHSLGQDDRLFFLIYDDKNRHIGHIGISHANSYDFEIDNMMRGESGGNPRLMYFAELSLLHWFFSNFDAKKANVYIMSYNWIVFNLHNDVGFHIDKEFYLYKYEKNGNTYHKCVKEQESNVKYRYIRLCLEKDGFYKNLGKKHLTVCDGGV